MKKYVIKKLTWKTSKRSTHLQKGSNKILTQKNKKHFSFFKKAKNSFFGISNSIKVNCQQIYDLHGNIV